MRKQLELMTGTKYSDPGTVTNDEQDKETHETEGITFEYGVASNAAGRDRWRLHQSGAPHRAAG